MDFDNPPPTPKDVDNPTFRESTVPKTQEVLQKRHAELREILQNPNRESLQTFVTNTGDEINRTVLRANPQENIFSTPDTTIMHAFGIPIWRKPQNMALEAENIRLLIDRLTSGQITIERFGKGVYFSEVLLHKYKNGNGRVARAMKILFDKSKDTADITEHATRKVLGIGSEAITQTGENTCRYPRLKPWHFSLISIAA